MSSKSKKQNAKAELSPMGQNVNIISMAIDKAFKSGVYGVTEASQVLQALGALQVKYLPSQGAPMEVVEDESGEDSKE